MNGFLVNNLKDGRYTFHIYLSLSDGPTIEIETYSLYFVLTFMVNVIQERNVGVADRLR